MKRKNFLTVLVCVALVANLLTVFWFFYNSNKLRRNNDLYFKPNLYDWQAEEYFTEIQDELDSIVDSLKNDEVFKTKTYPEHNFNWRYMEDPPITEETKNKILDFYYNYGYFMISVDKSNEDITHISVALSLKTYYYYVPEEYKNSFLTLYKNAELTELGENWYKVKYK